jgi:hypothetical protein
MATEDRKVVLKAREAAQYLRVSLFTLNRIERAGLLTPVRTPGGHRRYTLEMLNRYLEDSCRPRNESAKHSDAARPDRVRPADRLDRHPCRCRGHADGHRHPLHRLQDCGGVVQRCAIAADGWAEEQPRSLPERVSRCATTLRGGRYQRGRFASSQVEIASPYELAMTGTVALVATTGKAALVAMTGKAAVRGGKGCGLTGIWLRATIVGRTR